ncbi:hypothetical protein Acife_2573 [Acidithiobacillus ferrivorans SS3]|uniref:Uncharacterized protein n=1 Tax=Acidithiobacillus ferrivorans SS3 TaxID=743299 RepID=G0JQM2_9PROT|nr:hypothetical protein Acife_2573 [Acidithiobacillus ferrivorans SS3]
MKALPNDDPQSHNLIFIKPFLGSPGPAACISPDEHKCPTGNQYLKVCCINPHQKRRRHGLLTPRCIIFSLAISERVDMRPLPATVNLKGKMS